MYKYGNKLITDEVKTLKSATKKNLTTILFDFYIKKNIYYVIKIVLDIRTNKAPWETKTTVV